MRQKWQEQRKYEQKVELTPTWLWTSEPTYEVVLMPGCGFELRYQVESLKGLPNIGKQQEARCLSKAVGGGRSPIRKWTVKLAHRGYESRFTLTARWRGAKPRNEHKNWARTIETPKAPAETNCSVWYFHLLMKWRPSWRWAHTPKGQTAQGHKPSALVKHQAQGIG